MPEYTTIKKLMAGEVIDFHGILLKMDNWPIGPGDIYIAERNNGPKLLTAKIVDYAAGCIHPTTFGDYAFDIFECVKVCEVNEKEVRL